MLEIDPEKQKTLCDFLITQRELGIAIVDILKLKKRGNRLFYEKDGREIPVRRIYNRCIVDELERKNIELPFDFRDDARCGMGRPSRTGITASASFRFPISSISVCRRRGCSTRCQHVPRRQRELCA